MTELRPTVKAEWRVAYAFDPEREAVMLVAAAKHSGSKFYRQLIGTADARFDAHLRRLRQG